MKLFKFIRYFFGKMKNKLEEEQIISEEIEEILENVDWSLKDVIIGTVRSDVQFKYNIDKLCYYAPSRFISASNFPIRYVALYEGELRNGNGIRYYGKIKEILKVRRCEIPVSRNRNNEDELYYFFKIEKWNVLKNPLEVKDTVGGAPKFTNMFLLKNCFSTYQLFSINSPSQFKLMYNLETKNKNLYRINKTYSLLVEQNEIILLNNINNTKEKIRFSDYKEKPLEVFTKLKEKIYKQHE